MENGQENQASEQVPALAAGVAQAVLEAAKAGRETAGMAAGTAAAGPLGTVAGFLVTRKIFWKVLIAILLSVFLLFFMITNLTGLILMHLGLMDADGYVQTAKEREVRQIQTQIDKLMAEEAGDFAEISAVLDERREMLKREIEEEYEAEYGSLEHWEMELADEYTDCLKPQLSQYLAVLLAQNWNGSQTRSFLQDGTRDLYRTELTSPYEDYFIQAQEIYGIDAALLKAVAKVESDFTPDAVSPAGAVGIMQLMPNTAAALGVADPYDPKQNILGGARYLADSLAVFSGYDNSVELAVASYHAGVGAVKKAGYRIPQNGQTPGYVEKVLGYVQIGESGSLTPGRTGPSEEGSTGLQMLKKEVYSRREQMLGPVKEGVREEEREVTAYYRGSGDAGEEISEEDYDSYRSAGEINLSRETHTETWHVVSYRIVNLLDAVLPDIKGSYSWKYVTTPKRFLQAVEMLKFLTEESGQDAFIQKFGWKGLVDGYDAFEASYDADILTEEEAIRYDTVEGCIKEVVYYNQTEEPWASERFCGTTVKAAGCGPVSMAMVISTLTGQAVTPAEMADYTERNGLYVRGRGTSHSLPAKAAQDWGLDVCRVKDTQLKRVEQELRKGALAVVICREYTITGSGSGHYIVLTGVTGEGYFTVADPASRERSGRVYSPDTIRMYARDLDAGSIWIIK